MHEIRIFRDSAGREPFTEWLNSLRDRQARARIRTRVARVQIGNLGDYKTVGGGVCELRIAYGPGYRLYFHRDGDVIVLLLCGGDKSSQERDIIMAHNYLEDYRRRI